MNVLFMSLLDFHTIEERNIYTDLLREFVKAGHNVCVLSPIEKRSNRQQTVVKEKNCTILKPVIGNIQKTNYIEKGISTLTLERKLIKAVKTEFSDVRFELVIYSTPPITFRKVIEFVKRRDQASSYLLLKDIFPQNAVDLGILSQKGIKSILYRFFRKKEQKLYQISDFIGCMSEANVRYLLKHNPQLEGGRIEVCPNSLEPEECSVTENQKTEVRDKYGLSAQDKIFIYGGNIGKPQGIEFLIECIASCQNPSVHFLVVGEGTDYFKLEEYIRCEKKGNLTLLKSLPRHDYEQLTRCCDAGILLLDRRFTIPNFPSRMLSYMQAGIPVLAATDENTDVGEVMLKGGFGFWSLHGDVNAFLDNVDRICSAEDYPLLCRRSKQYLLESYTAECSYEVIARHFA